MFSHMVKNICTPYLTIGVVLDNLTAVSKQC
jgi:hypothetical protein